MKKIILILLSLLVATLSFYSCDDGHSSDDSSHDASQETTSFDDGSEEVNTSAESEESETSEAPFQKRDIYKVNSSDGAVNNIYVGKDFGIPGESSDDYQEIKATRNSLWGVSDTPESITVNWWGKECKLSRSEIIIDSPEKIDSATDTYEYTDDGGTLLVAVDLETQSPIMIANTGSLQYACVNDGFITKEIALSKQTEYVRNVLREIYPETDLEEYETIIQTTVEKEFVFVKYTDNVCTDKIYVFMSGKEITLISRSTIKNSLDALPEFTEEEYVQKAKEMIEEIYHQYHPDREVGTVSLKYDSDDDLMISRFIYGLNEYVVEYSVKYEIGSQEYSMRVAIPYADKDGNPLN